jgi:valyl-tRNA synthetase
MVMMSLKLCYQVSFQTIYLHLLIRDRYGIKMPKIIGNVIDPIHFIQRISFEDLFEWAHFISLHEMKKNTESFFLKFFNCSPVAMRTLLCSFDFDDHTTNLYSNFIISLRNLYNKIWKPVKFSFEDIQQVEPKSFQIIYYLLMILVF